MATLPGMAERTITISGASKTFAITGWRIGTIIAPAPLTAAIRKVHDFLTVGAPAPLQEGVAVAMETLPRSYYTEMAEAYRRRRDLLCGALDRAGFRVTPPQGAYYVLADYGAFSQADDTTFATQLILEAGVATVPYSSFTTESQPPPIVRFAFCKTETLLAEAGERLQAWGAKR